jgi:hypothetical protein
MLTRKENGKLGFNDLDAQILFSDLFELCNTEKEIDWVEENLKSYVEYMAEERRDEIEEDN